MLISRLDMPEDLMLVILDNLKNKENEKEYKNYINEILKKNYNSYMKY